MDDFEFSSADNVQAESSQSASRGSGLRLVIPSLKTIQALKGKKKTRNATFQDVPVQKVPRPLKLKPLKEVLTRLIAQIKKKDDYAFFLTPVDTSTVKGYDDVVKQPMDLGTMSTKVEKGRYRSLEDFTSDLRLVTGNAKLFNPPGTIYHQEADRIEAYALQHINKAAATVIEVETDWNVDVENEGEPTAILDDDDDESREKSTAMDVDGSARARSPSAGSAGTPVNGLGRPKTKGKKKAGMLSETLEEDGHIPGYKDGVGVFPPGSDFAELMLSLKLKGKRYRTKKERMRMERGGPPYHADGSLDYSEMEDPFTILSILAPESRTTPHLTPLYPPTTSPNSSLPPLPTSININPHRPEPRIRPNSKKASSKKRKHWTITRVASSRRGRDGNDDDSPEPWQVPREAEHVDYGSFATLVDQLAEESQNRTTPAALNSAEKLLEAIRGSVDQNLSDYSLVVQPQSAEGEAYWKQKAAPAEDYLRDVVYGGVEGLAYIRSLAAFVHHDESTCHMSDDLSTGLHVPLADWVTENVVDPLTDGRHRLLRNTAAQLQSLSDLDPSSVDPLLERSLYLLPQANQDLAALQAMSGELLDMASLIKKPDELFIADDVWAGASYMEEQRQRVEAEQEKALVESPTKNAAEYLAFAIQSHKEAETPRTKAAYEGPDVLLHSLNWSANVIQELASKETREDDMDVDQDKSTAEEAPYMRKLRLNLLALSKRAPLDKVARLPVDLVPVHIRHVIPTIESAP